MKMYSKRILTSALALGMCIGMTACGEDKTTDETTAETTAVTTTASETAAETTVETTAPETEEEKLKLNADLISEYGQTFAEISAKHGKVIDQVNDKGGKLFKFETGYGWYFFYGKYSIDTSTWVEIGDTGKKAPLPKDDYKCTGIDAIPASDFCDGDFEYLTTDDLENIDGITVTYNEVAGELSTVDGFVINLKYDGFSQEKLGFTDDRVIIHFFTTVKDRLYPDTMMNIYLHPSIAEKYLNLDK